MVDIVYAAIVFAIGLFATKYLPISGNNKGIVALLIIVGFIIGAFFKIFTLTA